MPQRKGRVLQCASAELCLEFVNDRLAQDGRARGWIPSPSAFPIGALTGIPASECCAAPAALVRGRAAASPCKAVDCARAQPSAHCREPDGKGSKRLSVFNEMLGAIPPRVRVAPMGSGTGWWSGGTAKPLDILAPIAWSAADLMTSPRAQRVRQCADETGCGYLFVDESRAGTRRWCSMGECGNRAKARRHYRRHKEPGADPGPAFHP
jgi:hypothetical protein